MYEITSNKKKIGIFDSGIGGLSVVKQIIKYLPEYDLVYFGDTARVPYGNKSNETIKKYALEDTEFLCKNNSEIIVIACNTASSIAYEIIKEKFPKNLIIDIILPGVERALEMSNNKKIGVIATKATINSKSHEKFLKKIDKKVEVFNRDCSLLVTLAESNSLSERLVGEILQEYIEPLVLNGIDTLILGCTHYPYFKNKIKNIFPDLKLVDPGEVLAIDLKKILMENKELNKKLKKDSFYEYFVSDEPQNFEQTCKKFLNIKNANIKKIDFNKR